MNENQYENQWDRIKVKKEKLKWKNDYHKWLYHRRKKIIRDFQHSYEKAVRISYDQYYYMWE